MLTLGIWKSIQPIVSENKSDPYFQNIIACIWVSLIVLPDKIVNIWFVEITLF